MAKRLDAKTVSCPSCEKKRLVLVEAGDEGKETLKLLKGLVCTACVYDDRPGELCPESLYAFEKGKVVYAGGCSLSWRHPERACEPMPAVPAA